MRGFGGVGLVEVGSYWDMHFELGGWFDGRVRHTMSV